MVWRIMSVNFAVLHISLNYFSPFGQSLAERGEMWHDPSASVEGRVRRRGQIINPDESDPNHPSNVTWKMLCHFCKTSRHQRIFIILVDCSEHNQFCVLIDIIARDGYQPLGLVLVHVYVFSTSSLPSFDLWMTFQIRDDNSASMAGALHCTARLPERNIRWEDINSFSG